MSSQSNTPKILPKEAQAQALAQAKAEIQAKTQALAKAKAQIQGKEAPKEAPKAPAAEAAKAPAPKAPVVEAPVRDVSGTKYINILVVGTDLSFAKSVQSSFNTLQATRKDLTYRIFPGTSKEKMTEFTEKYQLHSLLIEEEFMDSPAESWLKQLKDNLKKTAQNADIPVIVVSSKTDLAKTKNIVRFGYTDLILKPLDQSLFLQKMNMYNYKIPLTDSNFLFSLDTGQDVDVGFYFKTKSISEFGIKISSNKALDVGSVVTIYSSFAQENIAGVVKEVSKTADGQFGIFLMFIGITPSQTQAIRKFIRTNYAEGKQAG